jgi:hypothetical protein
VEDMTYEYEALNMGESMTRLLNNADFNKIFVDGFLKDDLVQLGYNFASNANMRNEFAEQIVARKHLRDYINVLISTGVQAKETIENIQYQSEGE